MNSDTQSSVQDQEGENKISQVEKDVIKPFIGKLIQMIHNDQGGGDEDMSNNKSHYPKFPLYAPSSTATKEMKNSFLNSSLQEGSMYQDET